MRVGGRGRSEDAAERCSYSRSLERASQFLAPLRAFLAVDARLPRHAEWAWFPFLALETSRDRKTPPWDVCTSTSLHAARLASLMLKKGKQSKGLCRKVGRQTSAWPQGRKSRPELR